MPRGSTRRRGRAILLTLCMLATSAPLSAVSKPPKGPQVAKPQGTSHAAPAPPTAPPGTRIHRVQTRLLGQLRYLVHLPPGGIPSGARLPVIVLLHGLGGLPENWLLDAGVGSRLDKAVREKRIPPCIVVIPQGNSGYWADWIDKKHPWSRWLTHQLLTDVRARYPVRSDAAGTAIVGASMGGFGALSAALRYPKRFGFAVSLSGTDIVLATAAQPRRRSYTRVWGAPIKIQSVRKVNPVDLVRAGAGRRSQRFLLGWGTREPAKFSRGGKLLAQALRKRGLDVRTRRVKGKGHGWRSAWAPLQPWWINALGRWLKAHPAPAGALTPAATAVTPSRKPTGTRAAQ